MFVHTVVSKLKIDVSQMSPLLIVLNDIDQRGQARLPNLRAALHSSMNPDKWLSVAIKAQLKQAQGWEGGLAPASWLTLAARRKQLSQRKHTTFTSHYRETPVRLKG